MDQFTAAYIECALWSSLDDTGEPLNGRYTIHDLAPETVTAIAEDCQAFQEAQREPLARAYEHGHYSPAHAGQDFWLTRCGHGAGFWDGDLPEPLGRELTDAAHVYGSVDLYVGDDGLIYQA